MRGEERKKEDVSNFNHTMPLFERSITGRIWDIFFRLKKDKSQSRHVFLCTYRCIGSVSSLIFFFYLKLDFEAVVLRFTRKFVELHVPSPECTAKPIAVTRVSPSADKGIFLLMEGRKDAMTDKFQ